MGFRYLDLDEDCRPCCTTEGCADMRLVADVRKLHDPAKLHTPPLSNGDSSSVFTAGAAASPMIVAARIMK